TTVRMLGTPFCRSYGVSIIHLNGNAECLPGLPTFNW
ncbi:DUF5983 family protein, partial [Escherichia coli]